MARRRGPIEEANEKAVGRILSSVPMLIDVQPAVKVLPGMKFDTIFHAGPPIGWERMCGPMKGAVICAIMFEGLAEDPKKAARLAETGEIQVSDSNHSHQAVGGMCGVTSASMPVWIVKNKTHGNFAYNFLSPGQLRFGAYDEEAVKRAKWTRNVLGPVFKQAIKEALRENGGIDLKTTIARSLQMGDEGHNRLVASTSLFLREMIPYLTVAGYGKDLLIEVVKSLAGPSSDLFFLDLMMPACKAMMDPAIGVKYSTVVTAIARNGVEVGIRVSGLGNKWFTAPANRIEGSFLPPYKEEDANADLGDSAIMETRGLGGTAVAAAPVTAQSFGLSLQEAIMHTRAMAEVSVARDNVFLIPTLDFEGTPVGIDVRKVVDIGTVPIVNTGIAHKDAGHSLIGHGRAKTPIECFRKALHAFAKKYA